QSSNDPCSSVPKTASSAATCTSASMREKRSSLSATRRAQLASSPMSAGIAATRRPDGSRAFAICSSFAAGRAASTTCAPSRSDARAISEPRPGPTPVTTTVFCESITAKPPERGAACYHAARGPMLVGIAGGRAMGVRELLKPRIQDFAMRFMDELRPETVGVASGDVLEVGFGTARNLVHYGSDVVHVTGLDPMWTEGVAAIDARIARAPFPVERAWLRADRGLPFDSGRFDCVVTTFTLCSIPEPGAALAEMRRVLRSGGRYVFIEHGR